MPTTRDDAPAPVTTARRGGRVSLRPWVAPAAVGAATVVATLALAVRSPHAQGSWGFCPSLLVTGLWCPACGGLRAVHELTQGDVVAALGFNAPVVLALPVVAALWAWWLLSSLGRAPTTGPAAALVRRLVGVRTAWFFLVLAVAFTVLRNLPGLELLAPV